MCLAAIKRCRMGVGAPLHGQTLARLGLVGVRLVERNVRGVRGPRGGCFSALPIGEVGALPGDAGREVEVPEK